MRGMATEIDTDLFLVLLQLERLNGSKLLDRLGDLSGLT
jgi:hypothetical protein